MPLLGENTMRPTAVVLNSQGNSGQRLLMVGGRQDRSSQCFSFKDQTWQLSPKLPLGHNLTTTICINWQEKAVFTFVIDAQLTVKSACLDLENATWTEHTTENTEEAYWALELQQSTHTIDRLHIKSGIAMDDGSINIVGRGRIQGMVEQIGGIVLNFKVRKDPETGKYSLSHQRTQRYFPSIFCRQLDHLGKMKNKIIMTQDTPDEEKFEAFSLDLGVKRSDGNN